MQWTPFLLKKSGYTDGYHLLIVYGHKLTAQFAFRMPILAPT